MEVLHEGWITKSPPLERTGYSLFKARWRRRWFVLQQGKLPRQYVLNYYADETKRRLKGTISLDECEQVDIGLTAENGRQRYEFMFDIKTPKRIYFLAVDTHEDMTNWVQMVCSACGLTSTKDDESVYSASQSDNMRDDTTAHEVLQTTRNLHEDATPQLSCASEASTDVSSNRRIIGKSGAHPSISSPYIHLSTCYAGKAPSNSNVGTDQSMAKPLSSPTAKLSNILPRGSASIFHGKIIDSLISSSSKGLGSRTRTKSSHSEAELIEAATSTKSFSSKASHGFSNSLKKIRRHSSTGGGCLKSSPPKISSDASKSSDRTGSMQESSSMDLDSMIECGPEGANGEPLPDENAPLSGNDGVTICDLRTQLQSGLVVLPPERPPKPAHLVSGSTNSFTIKPDHTDKVPTYLHSAENYANASDMQELYLREQNNNINGELQNQQPSQHIQYLANHVHQLHKHHHTHHHNAPSTSSQSVSKPNVPTDPHQVPMISRELKPNRRNITSRNRSQTIGGNMMASTYGMASAMTDVGDEASVRGEGFSSNLASNVTSNNFATLGPPVVRALKPKHPDTMGSRNRFNSLCTELALVGGIGKNEAESNSRRNSFEDEQIYYYMPPVNTTSGLGGLSSTLHPPLMIPAESFDNPSISYIDLDLAKTSSSNKVNSSASSEETLNDIKTLTDVEKTHVRAQRSLSAKDGLGACSNNSSENKTIYKTVDFIKTNALNRIKRDIESERGHAISDNQQFQPNMPNTLTGRGSNCGVVGAAGGNMFNREF